MMKALNKISIFAISAVLLAGCAACGQTNPGGEPGGNGASYADPNGVVSTYSNLSFNEYLLGEEATIENQWQGYGIGDPFAMRYNGVYYLYVSTLDTEIGVRGYKSADLVHWTPMTGEGLDTGYVSQDPVTLAAYAPEVYYFNGTFYMYTSPGGKGHYVLTSDSPEGPFVKATENFGMSIDGSVLIDDDEQMYFTYADGSGIRMARMHDMLNIDENRPILNDTSIGGWTEGPYILKRNGIYYLTYTGNHVASDGYRIAYSTATDLSEQYRSAFVRAQNNPLALETETALKGVGHSSTVMGPDMDSYYLVYHYLNSSGGPNRSLGIDRLTFDGTMMSVAPTLEKSVTPALPAFYATGKDGEKFDTSGDFLLSKTSASASFTAEYNVTGTGTANYVFGYTDGNNYMGVTVNLSQKTVQLNKTVNGSTSQVASGTLVNDFSAEKLHTVRISSRDGKVDVCFDNMTKIDGADLSVPAGKIGYRSLGDDAQVGYTAYSDVAMGMSDEQEAKQITTYTGASNYLRGNAYTQAPVLGGGSAVTQITEDEDYRFAGWNKLTLNNKGDSVSYLLYNGTAGRYGLELVYPASDGGKKIGVKVDGVNGGTVYRCTLPEVKDVAETDFVRAVVGEFTLDEGARIVRLENVGKPVSYTAFRFVETSDVTPVFEQRLDNYVGKGADYKTIWKLKDGGHYAKAGTRQLVYFGDNTITDFTLEVEMKLEGASGSSSTAGIVFHAQNYAASTHDSYMSLQGYYFKLGNNSVQLEKLNYADGSEKLASDGHVKIDSDIFYKVKIQVRGNAICIWLNDEKLFEVDDGWNFANGKIGLYTDGAAAVYKNLKISG